MMYPMVNTVVRPMVNTAVLEFSTRGGAPWSMPWCSRGAPWKNIWGTSDTVVRTTVRPKMQSMRFIGHAMVHCIGHMPWCTRAASCGGTQWCRVSVPRGDTSGSTMGCVMGWCSMGYAMAFHELLHEGPFGPWGMQSIAPGNDP